VEPIEKKKITKGLRKRKILRETERERESVKKRQTDRQQSDRDKKE
jgi:hypothetical protein